jgi:hypothetical protein
MARLGSGRRPGSNSASRETQAVTALAPSPRGVAERVLVIASGVRQPIVAILILISFFTVLSGKPLDGLLLVTVAMALAWDASMNSRQATAKALVVPTAPTGSAAEAPAAAQGAWRLRSRPPRLRLVAVGSAAAVVYALTIGSFTRYSWPATAGVVGLGASVVVVGWGGPTRQRQIPAKFTRVGAFTWGALFLAASLWELTALLMQPNIETSSYAHPTISTLTDPLLASAPGRFVAVLGWIALGAYLVER